MSKIMQKLHSRSGASMLLAMVFMMFCTFVGGTVLAAAFANGNRAAQQSHNQQAYLNQRSAALVIADQLTKNADNGLQMTLIIDNVNAEIKTEPTIKSTSETPTDFQTLLYALAENKFKLENGYNVPPIDTDTIQITDPQGNTLGAKYKMEDDYSFVINFADGQLHLYLEPVVGETETERQELGSDGTMNTITTKTTIIRWNDPVIKKGGA